MGNRKGAERMVTGTLTLKELLDNIWNNCKIRRPNQPAIWNLSLVKWFGYDKEK